MNTERIMILQNDDDDDDDYNNNNNNDNHTKEKETMRRIDRDHLQAFLLRRIREMEAAAATTATTTAGVTAVTPAIANNYDETTTTTTSTSSNDYDNNNNNENDDVCEGQRRAFAAVEADRILHVLQSHIVPPATTTTKTTTPDDRLAISQDEFCTSLQHMASTVDIRHTWPIVASMLLVGSSVGITTPAFPFVVQSLGLSTTQYGLVVSAFALAKLLGNVPSAILVERHGRKPYLTYSLAVLAVATAGVGVASSFEELYLTRLVAGVGVAAMSTGATLMMTDLSTPLNRATTLAPAMSAFAAGMTVGPACGGYLIDAVGLSATFGVVGLCFLGVAGVNAVTMSETKYKALPFPWQQEETNHTNNNPQQHRNHPASNDDREERGDSLSTSVKNALGQWGPLLQNVKVRRVMMMNGWYWIALAGAQMTLLPLILTDPDGMNMSATQVGQLYAGMSVIQIVGNPLFARVADQVGKAPTIVSGCSLISLSMVGLTLSPAEYLHVSLGTWAVGSSMLSTAPVAYVSDQVDDDQRAQALALLRTFGDVGFLIGASGTGVLADALGSCEAAMQSSATLLATATLWFTVRQTILSSPSLPLATKQPLPASSITYSTKSKNSIPSTLSSGSFAGGVKKDETL